MRYLSTNTSFLRAFIIFFVITSFIGCRLSRGNEIAFVFKTLSNPFFIEMERGALDQMTEYQDYKLIRKATRSETDIDQQIQIVEDLITRNVSIICITPNDSKAIIPAIVKANQNNIPVIIVDTIVDEELAMESRAHWETFVGSDNLLGGKLAGDYMASALNYQGKVAILEGFPGQETAIARKDGFLKAVKKYPQIEVVSSQTAEWRRDLAVNVFQNILQTNPSINGLFACNDEMALGAIQAIEEKGGLGEIIVVGFDATPDGINAIKAGRMNATVAQYPVDMGRLAIESAIRILGGRKVPRVQFTGVKIVNRQVLRKE